MKISINASILDPRPAGLGTYAINIISRILKSSEMTHHNIDIFTSRREYFINNVNTNIIRIPRFVEPSGYGVYGGIFRFVWNQLFYTIHAKNSDLSYSPTHHSSLFLNDQIITVHDLIAIKFPEQHKLQFYYCKYILPILLRRSIAVITSSESSKSDILDNYDIDDKKIHVVYLGYNKDIFKINPLSSEIVRMKYGLTRFIMSVGATLPHKNIKKLIMCYNDLNDDLKATYKLVIAGGRQKYLHDLKEIISQLGLEDHVILFSYLNIDDLAHLYNTADVYVHPSLYEGFGLPPVEAMACGCPVIASNTSSLPEVCGNAAIYMDPYDINDMSCKLTELLQSSALRDVMKSKGLKMAKKYSWDAAAGSILNIISNALIK